MNTVWKSGSFVTVVFLCIQLLVLRETNATEMEITAGVLKFGTVNWELNVVKHHRLDSKEGLNLIVNPS